MEDYVAMRQTFAESRQLVEEVIEAVAAFAPAVAAALQYELHHWPVLSASYRFLGAEEFLQHRFM